MPTITVRLRISASDYLRWYRGTVNTVQAVSTDGRTIKFPASILQRFVTKDGVNGTFALRFDKNNKLESVRKLS